jgi:pSer/pThr/pTyr-binding forkhead associated (FHA) protein
MAKLIMSLDTSVLREITLDRDRLTIGRKPTNDIHIDNLAVSGDHARIVMLGSDWVLEDLGSTNGTLVNGAPVKNHVLRNNDLIGLGKYKLKFIAEGVAARPAAEDDIEKTMVIRPGAAASRAPARPAPAARPAPRPAPAPPAGMFERLKSWLGSWFK